jgi:cytochrome c
MALGKSKVIKDLSKDQIKNALMGYKNGTYGGSMKTIMQGQASTLSETQVGQLADYVSSLK